MKVLIVLYIFVSCSNYQTDKKLIQASEIKSMNGTEKEIKRLYDSYRSDFPLAPEIYVKDLDITSDVILVDVREREEQNISMIKGALTQEEFKSRLDLYKEKTVVVYCTIGYRSGVYTEELVAMGINAYNLVGGVLSWSHASRFFYKDGIETKDVHVYGKEWDLLAQGYVSFYF